MHNYLLPFNLSEDALSKLATYAVMLQTENEKVNLTAITDLEGIYIKHFYDCLNLNKVISKEIKNIIDIGSGAGFPGIPLKISSPDINITLLEPTLKRVNFLNKVINELKLEKIDVIPQRAEDFQKTLVNKYDAATSRAVASLSVILELSAPLVNVGGHIYALKGQNYETEIETSKNALNVLGCKIFNLYQYELPNDQGSHVIIDIIKVKETPPIYPRHYSKIKKQPL